MNCLNVSGGACGKRIGVGVPGAAGDTVQPGILQISPLFAVWKLLHLKFIISFLEIF